MSHLHLRDCGTKRSRFNTQSPIASVGSGHSSNPRWRHVYVAPAMYPQICSRYYDHDGTRSRVCISEEKAFPLSARAPDLRKREGRKQGAKKTDGRSGFSCENATGLFCQRWSCARAMKSRERGEGVGLREKSAVQGKKNRRSVGKRNYRLMRRSFRHVGFERESAIGRCFFAKVIRVFARSLSSSPSSLFFSRSRARSIAIFLTRAPREPP